MPRWEVLLELAPGALPDPAPFPDHGRVEVLGPAGEVEDCPCVRVFSAWRSHGSSRGLQRGSAGEVTLNPGQLGLLAFPFGIEFPNLGIGIGRGAATCFLGPVDVGGVTLPSTVIVHRAWPPVSKS